MCWNSGFLPDVLRDANIINIYKTRGAVQTVTTSEEYLCSVLLARYLLALFYHVYKSLLTTGKVY